MDRSIWRKIAPGLGLLGAIVLLAGLLYSPGLHAPRQTESRPIQISREQVENSLKAAIAETPSLRDTRNGLFEEIKEGAIARNLLIAEAVSQGLAENDTIIRNRLVEIQILALYEKADALIAPEAVEKHFTENRHQYLTFPSRRYLHLFTLVTNVTDDVAAKKQLGELFQNKSQSATPRWTTENRLRRRWGPTLAQRIFEMPLSQWSLPIRSKVGWHRIKVLEEKPERPHELGEVRTWVTEDLRRKLRREAYDKEISRLKKKYKVELID
ncbi:MAG: peptidyl-prolyl cis-trans isomerase [Proteobacteria bacterium]|nr:peptidyl-prolyl cis-trans isomerase [Pseudomonadota bacterium]